MSDDTNDTVPEIGARPPRTRPDTLEPGVSIGRYRLIESIGEGGMGVVYAAHDPELDRRVALKFVRGNHPAGSKQQARLLREAHAMAKLSHPNVLPIYDVGTFRGRVFLALELVEGTTLEEWLESTRNHAEVIDKFVDAGRGLAAAHSAELIHRDFKPSNVLVGNDDRVRVTDFGLARVDRSEAGEDVETVPIDEQLTVAGSIMGTLAYMAPEQRRGGVIDARSDQFSFCVALYEALYREQPFPAAGGEEDTRWQAVDAAQIRDAPKGTRVPVHVRRALVRGLAADPDHRHRSMDALIAALRTDPAAVWRRNAIRGGIAVTVAGALGLAWSSREDAIPPCRGSEKLLAGAWDDPVRTTIAARFDALGKPFATEAWARTRSILDQ